MPSQTVTKRTNLLIVGELGWPLLDDGRPSNKLRRASAYGVPVVSERRFLEWIGKAIPDSVHKTYSADQLAALSKLSSDMIRELAQFGLLDERGGRLASATLRALVRSRSCLRMGFDYPKSFMASARSGNGCLKLGWPMCGSVPDPSTASRSNSLGDVPTNAASSCSQLRSPGTMLTICLSRHSRPRRLKTLQKPSASTAFSLKAIQWMHRRRSTSETCSGLMPAISKAKRHCGPRRALIRLRGGLVQPWRLAGRAGTLRSSH